MSRILVRDVVSGIVNAIDPSAPVLRIASDWRHRIKRLSLGSETPRIIDALPLFMPFLHEDDWLTLLRCSKVTRLALLSQHGQWEALAVSQRWFPKERLKLRVLLPVAVSRLMFALQAAKAAWYDVDVHLNLTAMDFHHRVSPEALLAVEAQFSAGYLLPATLRASLMLRNGQPSSTLPGRTLFGARLLSAEEMLAWRDAVAAGTETEPAGWEGVIEAYAARSAAVSDLSTASSAHGLNVAPAAVGGAGAGSSACVPATAEKLGAASSLGASGPGVLIPISADFGSRRLFVHSPSGLVLSVHGATVAVAAANFLHLLRKAVR